MADKSLYKQVEPYISESRKKGPTLTYILTIAGHSPYEFNASALSNEVAITSGPNDTREPIHRELNINWHASFDIAAFVKKIRADDPDGLIVVLGDHLPDVALYERDKHVSQSIGVPLKAEYYQTPFVFVDAKGGPAPKLVMAYELPGLVLERLGVSPAGSAELRYFKAPANFKVRPLNSSTAVLNEDGTSAFCKRQTESPECARAIAWRENAEVVSYDILKGAQQTVKSRHPP